MTAYAQTSGEVSNDQAAPVCQARNCTRPGNPVICAPDTRRLGDWLAQLGAEYEQLTAAPTMQGREVGMVGGTALTSQRAPGNTHVMALRDRRRGPRETADPWGVDDTPSVYATLTYYARLVRDGRQLATDGRTTVATERRLLSDHLDWAMRQDWAGQFHDEIRGLWGVLRRANGHAPVARKIHRLQAPCPGCSVRALTHRPGTPAVTCENCGHSETVPELDGISA